MLHLYEKVKNTLKVPFLSRDVKYTVSKLIYTYKQKLEKSHRNYERCKNANKNWFATYVSFPVARKVQKGNSSGGRPLKDFEDCASRTKRKRTEEVRKNFISSELAYATQMEYRAIGELKKSKSIKNISMGITSQPSSEPHATFTPDKALSLIIIEGHLTKYQYNTLRNSALELNCNLYPNYESVTEAKKNCYPKGISCTETKAEVSLQSLLDKTAERLLLSLKEVILNLSHKGKTCVLYQSGDLTDLVVIPNINRSSKTQNPQMHI